MVAIRSTVAASKTVGSRVLTLCSLATVSISRKRSRLLLLAQPSVPMPTQTPARISSGTGAIPEASFMLLSGLWDDLDVVLP